MRTSSKAAAALVALVLVGTWLPDDAEEPARERVVAAQPAAPAPPTRAAPTRAAEPAPAASREPTAATTRDADADLLRAASGGDGDSWRDTAGREYRLGMVNAPEVGECFGAKATSERKRLTRKGFRADVYARDRYGRSVAVVTAADGTNLNVSLARRGFVDDRYLADFRDENPRLAAQLDAAFAAAKADGVGLWSACRRPEQVQGLVAPPPAAAPPAASRSCHPDYVPCIPVQGDGSGRGAANDLDCGDVDGAVRLRQAAVDPYRLDADGDGVGCDS